MNRTHDYIPDWTEQAGPWDEQEPEEEYSDQQELIDEEERYERKMSSR